MRVSMRCRAVLAVLLLAGPVVSTLPAFAQMGQREIEEALTCQCGCGLTVATCNHLECGFAVPVRKEIAEALARGETGPQILEHYKKEYGEKVLSSPVPEGFNILAWVAPYLAILVSGIAMTLFFRSRARRTTDAGVAATGSAPAGLDPEADARRARLREEVKELEQ